MGDEMNREVVSDMGTKVLRWSTDRKALPPASGPCETQGCPKAACIYDHCHEHDVIRGLLCSQCNTDMRWLDHNIKEHGPRRPYLADVWLRCEPCRARFRLMWPDEAWLQEYAPGAFVPPAGKPWETLPVKMPAEMKQALHLAKADDHIEVSARIRAMVALWQEGGKFRAEVDKLARTTGRPQRT